MLQTCQQEAVYLPGPRIQQQEKVEEQRELKFPRLEEMEEPQEGRVLLIPAELALVQQEEVNLVLWLVWEGREDIVRVEKAA